MKHLVAILLPLFLFACGDKEEDPWTWGDSAQEISDGWCYAVQQCGGGDAESCSKHQVYHFCELHGEGVCDLVPQDSEGACLYDTSNPNEVCSAEQSAIDCREEFAKFVRHDEEGGLFQCFSLTFGNLPDSCWDALSFRPDA